MSSIAKLSNIFSAFRNSSSDESQSDLYREALLMALARATDADANISPVEVQSVRDQVEKLTGQAISAADVRVAAASELYETAPLEQYLASAGKRLSPQQRSQIVAALAEIIKADVHVTDRETAFFDMVARALKLTPSEIAGLTPD